MGLVLGDDEVAAIRASTPGCREELIHLNHAGSSLPPRVVLDTQIEHLQREAEIGGYEAADEAAAQNAAVYDSIARLVGAEAHQIARCEHATAAWNAAFWSLPMRRGQRIITHDHDYGANVIAFLRAAEVCGVVVDRLPNDETGQINLDALAQRLVEPDDVALVSLAWIPTNGGLVNPAAAVGELTSAAGVPFLLDACQAIGHLDIDVRAVGCDFLSATGRKYLRGPRGTGFLYVDDAILDRAIPAQPDHHGAEWLAPETYRYLPGARRFEYWEYGHAGWLGLGAAVDVALELGTDRIEATIRDRSDRLRTGLVDIGMTIHDLGRDRAGIVTATHPVLDATEVMNGLRRAWINTSTTHVGSSRYDVVARDLPPLVRLSVHCTTTVEEVDRTLDVLTSL